MFWGFLEVRDFFFFSRVIFGCDLEEVFVFGGFLWGGGRVLF